MKSWKFCFTKNTKTTAEWFLLPFMINTCKYRSIWSADFLTYRWLDDYFDLYITYLCLQFSVIIRQRSVNVTSIFCNFSEMKYRLLIIRKHLNSGWEIVLHFLFYIPEKSGAFPPASVANDLIKNYIILQITSKLNLAATNNIKYLLYWIH